MLPDLLQVVQRTDDGATVLDGSLVGAHGGVPTRIAQGLGAGGLIRGDERVQIVGVLEMQVAEQPALGERLARRQRVDGQQPAERAVFGGRISGAEHESGGAFETVLDDMVDGVFVGVEAGVVLGESFDGERGIVRGAGFGGRA